MNLVLWGSSVYIPPLNCRVLFLTLSRVIAMASLHEKKIS